MSVPFRIGQNIRCHIKAKFSQQRQCLINKQQLTKNQNIKLCFTYVVGSALMVSSGIMKLLSYSLQSTDTSNNSHYVARKS